MSSAKEKKTPISVRRTETPPEQLYPRAALRAAERCTFDLTFHRSSTPRRFEPGYLGGELIADARIPGGTNCGGWEHLPNSVPESDDLQAWFDHYASMAIAQCIHEALEWFHIDGDLWLDPHDERVSEEIDQLCAEFSQRMADLRRELAGTEEEAA